VRRGRGVYGVLAGAHADGVLAGARADVEWRPTILEPLEHLRVCGSTYW
jgi:hypothetical protein